jgi:hypothetical protein
VSADAVNRLGSTLFRPDECVSGARRLKRNRCRRHYVRESGSVLADQGGGVCFDAFVQLARQALNIR